MAAWCLPVVGQKDANVCLRKHKLPSTSLEAPATPKSSHNIELGRLKKRSEFLRVRGGRYQARPHIVIQMRARDKQDYTPNQINVGFTATKKIGNAVIRNKCKRRLRELARALLPEYGKGGYDYVFIARATTAQANWADLRKDVEKALLRLA